MVSGILAKKVGMTRIFTDDGTASPCTVVKAGPCFVLDVKDKKLLIGFDELPLKKIPKPLQGIVKKKGFEKGFKFLKEVDLLPSENETEQLTAGKKIDVSIFSKGEKVDVIGRSKGKGFQGVMKRWGFSGGAKTHGSMFHRRPGSIGQHTEPAKVWKGKKMPGHKGSVRVTVKNLVVMGVDKDRDILILKGAVPGYYGSLLFVRKTMI